MLNVQRYLREKCLDDLKAELGIKVAEHPEGLPLVILNYDQLESPKTHPVVRECRGLVLERGTWDIVARSFPRFFNWGEVQDEMDLFDFSDFMVQSKEDGSLCLLYYYAGKWYANTRGSFALDLMQHQQCTWREGMCAALGVKDLQELDAELDRNVTYVCEFCSPWNKVVRRYESPVMYLLSAFVGLDEVPHDEVDKLGSARFLRPTKYQFSSMEAIQAFLTEKSESDPTFEGVVICDRNRLRYKIKNPCYLALHRLKGNNNIFHPKNLLPFILTGEDDELLLYFNEVRPAYFELKTQVQEQYIGLLETWADTKDIEDQKEFALAVKGKPLASVLFNTRKKYGKSQRSSDLRNEFRAADQLLLKRLISNAITNATADKCTVDQYN